VDKKVGGVAFQEVLMEMGRSTFCLAVAGAGWGVRLKFAVMTGCIPVVIADEVEVNPSLHIGTKHLKQGRVPPFPGGNSLPAWLIIGKVVLWAVMEGCDRDEGFRAYEVKGRNQETT